MRNLEYTALSLDLSAAARATHLRYDCPAVFEDGGSFRRNYPAFGATSLLDGLRATEYARLDALDKSTWTTQEADSTPPARFATTCAY